MRHVNVCFYALAVCAVSFFWPYDAQATRKIGVLMFSEESRYQVAARGMMDKLREEGMVEPGTIFLIENAGANKARAVELVKKFAAEKLDLIFTLGTSATAATAREIHDVPIVFAVVYDPVEAGIAKSWQTSGNNTTGTSTKLSMTMILDPFKSLKTVKKMAVLYTPGERNSELVYKDLQQTLSAHGIRIIPVPLTKKEDIAVILPAVIRTVDAIYITGSNLIDSQVSMIADMATQAKVVTVTHLEDLVQKGVLLGVCADPYQGGRLSGEKAVQVLKGTKPSAIPIEPIRERRLLINRETMRAGQFHIPQELLKRAQ